jgi:hypothetical protein
MTKHEALPEATSFTSYDETQRDKLRSARTGIGLCIFVLALAAIVPSVFEGRRGGPWISWPTIFCATLCVVNVLVYARYTARLRKVALLEIAPNQSPDPTLSSGTSRARHDPRLP